SGETVYLRVLHQQGVLIVHHVFRPDDTRQVLEVGSMQPLHSTALGKVLVAYDPVARGELGDGPYESYTVRTLTGAADVDAECALIRERGWADSIEETWEGVASIGALIQDRRRNPVGAVCISGAVERVCEDGFVKPSLVASVRSAARAISRDLGAGRF
ncbi:IclR family transcriptional regulator, partial [Kitasatospora sp. NPDC091257]|uniref:IclR family transcriptional regulator n=1 Tax=Kitasatospora sp. NPDC091257 TaxID=3364084 RepID=UPI0038048831